MVDKSLPTNLMSANLCATLGTLDLDTHLKVLNLVVRANEFGEIRDGDSFYEGECKVEERIIQEKRWFIVTFQNKWNLIIIHTNQYYLAVDLMKTNFKVENKEFSKYIEIAEYEGWL